MTDVGLALALLSLALTGALIGLRKLNEEAQKPVHLPATRVAFGSCLKQDLPQGVWNTIAATNPDCFLFLGDNVYNDTEDMAVMARVYAELGAHPEYAAFKSAVPVYATWDDHDYGVNDGGVEYPKKEESKKIMLDFFDEPADSERRKRPGIYTSYACGPDGKRLQIILLDLRWSRTPIVWDEKAGGYVPTTDPNATMIGAEQWRWLEEELKKPADLRLIGSSLQMVSSEHNWEKWSNFPHEKKRLYELFDRLAVPNAFVLSGDMHYGELSVEKTAGGTTVYDLTSSGMNYHEPGAHFPNSRRLAVHDRSPNFGLVEIDWERRVVSLQVRDDKGLTVLRHDVQF